MLVDDCHCVDLVIRTAEVVPAETTVVAIGREAPVYAGAPAKVRALADPDGVLVKKVAPTLLQTPGRPPVLFVTGSGEVALTLPAARSIDEIRATLDVLARATPSDQPR
jgi:hypothetical protein